MEELQPPFASPRRWRRRLVAAAALVVATIWYAHPGKAQETGEDVLDGVLMPVAAGSELREEASHTSPLLDLVPADMLPVLELGHPWIKVRHGEMAGWINVDDPCRSPLPPPTGVDLGRLARARRLLGSAEQVAPLGQLVLYTDVDDPPLVEFLAILFEEVRIRYRERYGLEPGDGREAVVLFADEETYRTFEKQDATLVHVDLAGQAAGGVVALFLDSSPRRTVGRTLVHELTHLLNRRAFGPILPQWLDEGIAQDLALSRMDDRGGLSDTRLGRRSIRFGRTIEVHGPLVWLRDLVAAADGDYLFTLSQLMEKGQGSFFGSESTLLYALSAFWVRFLLSGPQAEMAERFRRFLARLQQGDQAGPEQLAAILGHSLDDLEQEFRAWLRGLPRRLRLPAGRT